MRRHLSGAAVFLLLACVSAFAQQTTGTISGRVVDQQGAAIPGVAVTAKSASTGFTRSEVSNAEGVYRLSALPVGIYEVNAELQGFATVSKKDVEVNVAQVQAIDFSMKVTALAETVNVTGATPLSGRPRHRAGGSPIRSASRACRSTAASSRTSRRRSRASASPSIRIRRRPRSTRRRSTAATAAT